jgi:hypothetical protein
MDGGGDEIGGYLRICGPADVQRIRRACEQA